MLSVQSELVWQGRVHLGDEPGVYADPYSGIALEFPITLNKIDPAAPDTTVLVLRSEGLETYASYPGHLITVAAHTPIPGSNPPQASETVLTTARFTGTDNNQKNIHVNLAGLASPVFLSLQVRVDVTVPPGLYDDFVVLRLENQSANFGYVASFGFHA